MAAVSAYLIEARHKADALTINAPISLAQMVRGPSIGAPMTAGLIIAALMIAEMPKSAINRARPADRVPIQPAHVP